MTSTMSHCWVRTLCAWVCKKCAKYHHIFVHLNAYPRNVMCVQRLQRAQHKQASSPLPQSVTTHFILQLKHRQRPHTNKQRRSAFFFPSSARDRFSTRSGERLARQPEFAPPAEAPGVPARVRLLRPFHRCSRLLTTAHDCSRLLTTVHDGRIPVLTMNGYAFAPWDIAW